MTSQSTPGCRCYGCGASDPMACGRLCADCSWEDHLAGMAYTGTPYAEPLPETPACCLASRDAENARLAS